MSTTHTPTPEAANYRPIDPVQTKGAIAHGDLLAVSGGRFAYSSDLRYVALKCGNGYYVEIRVTPADLYEVSRVYCRGGKRFLKGVAEVHVEDLSETVYRAGMFRDSWPAGGIA